MPGKILLVWEEIPESVSLYVLDEGTKIAELALASAGFYINSDDTEGHPIEELNEALVGREKLPADEVAVGPFSKVVVCGSIM